MNSVQQAIGELDRLQTQIERALERLASLEEENRSLHARQESLIAERAGLVQRNEEARVRVESMIERLKSLEAAG